MKEGKESAKAVRPLLKAFAVVGTGSGVSFLVSTVGRFSDMSIATFATRQEAMDWLAEQ